MLAFLIVAGVFLLWLGTALRPINRAYAGLAFALGVIFLLLATGGFFGLF
ncbi:MAG: hypothetical protein LJE74_11560 [Proteobacteria bacterium]|jgi:hypothetical protein|nr:hypothetical protein [Pseudomonadota bacterium]MCG6935642.1 hypothetical protein [Pseudomonadota bacterium]